MQTFETVEPIELVLQLARGTARISTGQRADTVVSVEPSDRNEPRDVQEAERTAVELIDGVLSIRGHRMRSRLGQLVGWRRDGSVDVVVELPEGSLLRTETGWVDLDCTGILGDVEVTTACGSVRLDRTGSARVKSGLGGITVGEASGRVDLASCGTLAVGSVAGDSVLRNRSGRTWIGRAGGDVRVSSAYGDIEIDSAAADVTARTACGDIRLGRVARGEVGVETGFGGLAVGIGEGAAAWVDASTGFGRVRNGLSAAEEAPPSAGAVRVRARSWCGDIVITRSAAPAGHGGV